MNHRNQYKKQRKKQRASLPSLFITGTDTGIGKTVITGLLLKKYAAAGVEAAPFKPVAAGSAWLGGRERWADTEFLAAAAGTAEVEAGLYRLPEPLSPHLAAAAAGVEIEIGAIAARYRELAAAHEAVLVEGAGGIAAPVSEGESFLDVAAALALPVLIVTSADLGTLNHTLLTASACRERGLEVAGLIVNRYPAAPDEAQRRNPAELERLTGVPVLGLVPELDVSVDDCRLDGLASGMEGIDLARLELPVPGKTDVAAADRDHVWHPFSSMLEYLAEQPRPLMITAARGSRLYDADGRGYIDGTASLWVNVHGHRHPALDRAVRRQLGRVAHSTLLGLGNEPSALLARELADITPAGLKRVFYSDNGSTAVEIALKVAFQYQKQSGRPEKQEFISFVNAYHGDTIGAVSVGGHELFHSIFRPLLFKAHLAPAAYCYRCPVGLTWPGCGLKCLDGFERLLGERADRVAAVVVEPRVQGAAGIIVQPPGYLRRIADLCREHGVLLIADEVATGFGRTGTLFACEQEGVEPDIMALAKGLTGGYLPLAATLFKEEIYEAFLGRFEELKTFFHGHTYTGNPLACAAALANIELLRQPGFLPGVGERAALLSTLLEPLKELEHVGEVRQLGMMAGIELVADRQSREPWPVAERMGRQVILKARERGVIIRPLGDTVVIMPPLAIGEEDLRELVEVTRWAISEVTSTLSS